MESLLYSYDSHLFSYHCLGQGRLDPIEYLWLAPGPPPLVPFRQTGMWLRLQQLRVMRPCNDRVRGRICGTLERGATERLATPTSPL